jgi:uncharacterized protein YoxC
MYMAIPIYRQEILDGLQHKIKSKACLAYTAELSLAENLKAKKIDEEKLHKLLKANVKSLVDLHPLNSIMVSTGWNLNDDVFERSETWASRNTPEDKPLNYQHDFSDIIGHIIGCSPIDEEYNIIPEVDKDGNDTSIEDLPSKFHIFSTSVLYKVWHDNKDLQKRMDTILAELPEGKWFVSMECLFSNYDYAIVLPDGSQKIIVRNEESSFLTKYLRAYGGTGIYNGCKIGRLPRNLIFSGKGLVKKPANPDSVIFAKQNIIDFDGRTFASCKEIVSNSKTVGYMNGISGVTQQTQEMDDMTLEQLNAKVDALTKQNNQLQVENEQLKAKIAALEADVNVRDEQLSFKASELAKANEKIIELSKKVDELSADLADANEEIARNKAERVKSNRISILVEKLGVDKNEASELFDITTSLTDELFARYVEKTRAAYFNKKKKEEKDRAEVDKKSRFNDVTAKDLDNVSVNKDVALATSGVNEDKVERRRIAIANMFEQSRSRANKTTRLI